MSGAPPFPGCIGTQGCSSLCSPMKAQPKASLTTRFPSWSVVTANRRGYMGHFAILGA
jgi:hypothetical protein